MNRRGLPPLLLPLLLALSGGLAGCDDGDGDTARDDAAAADTGPSADLGADVGEDCNPGTEDCRCLTDGTCRLAHLACIEGRCLDPAALCDPTVERCPPADPQCYTPCRGDLLAADGSLRACSPEGLMPGCLAGSQCQRGSCVPEAGASKQTDPGACEHETDCPDFQTCLAGRCYSDCANDADCAEAHACHRHVCRPICGVGAPCLAAAEACNDGVCLPLARPGDPAPLATGESFDVSTANLRFTSSLTEARFTVYNTGSRPLTLTVRKEEQLTIDEEGREERVVDQPLLWLEMGVDTPARVQTFEARLEPGAFAEIALAGAQSPAIGRWEGRLAIEAPGLGTRHVRLSYSQEVRGRWVGTAYAFGNFPDGARPWAGQFPLDDWRADRDNLAPLASVQNAFLRAWGRFRSGEVDFDLSEMAAIVDATLTGSWDFPRVRALCREAGFDENTLCAPFGGTGSRSVIAYTSRGDVDRVPTGVIAMDFAIEVTPATGPTGRALCDDAPNCFTGRIDSDTALQYAGDPLLVLTFAADPTRCARQGAAGCTVDLDRFAAAIGTGLRFRPESLDFGLGGVCSAADAVERPWLVPGLTPPDFGYDRPGLVPPIGGDGVIRECHGAIGPGDPGADANPLPDGQPRLRHLELIDGQMIEQHVMTLILRETIDAFHGGEPLTTYLYVVLEKTEADPAELRTEGNPVRDDERRPVKMTPTCDPALIEQITGHGALDALDRADADELALAMVAGGSGAVPSPLPAGEAVHALCIWTEDAVQNRVDPADPTVRNPERIRREVIDAGPDGDRPCFPGAEIIYFTTAAAEDPAGWDCNRSVPETCLTELETRAARGDSHRFNAQARTYLEGTYAEATFDLIHRCVDPDRTACSDNRFDLVDGKVFGRADGAANHYSALGADIAQAFRYKTQFVDRIGGAGLGFAPAICRPGSALDPYCYDPRAIEAVRDRIDCAFALYNGWLDEAIPLSEPVATALRTSLTRALDAIVRPNPFGDPIVESGFERLYAELLIMLGDDAYTAAFASRFDLAGNARLPFEGSRFESDGIDLTGAAGYEMYKLHQAIQYYGLVLDRFFSMSVELWRSLGAGAGDRYVTAGTVTTWIDRVVRASTQSANASSEVARRYRTFNRPDLARRVLVRAYTRAWQESLILRALMTEITGVLDPDELPQIEAAIAQAQTRYRVSMLDMQARFQQIGARLDSFGLPPEFIPFPALDEDDVNGFEIMLDRAVQRMELALEDEDTAIASRRDFDVDAASFQSELVTLRNGYEARLGELCGTFQSGGRIYPAIARYAHLDATLATLDDPCGAAGNGQLWLTGGNLQARELDLQRVRQEVSNIQSAMLDAQRQVADHCRLIFEDVGTFIQSQGIITGLERDNDRMDAAVRQLDKVHDFVTEFTSRLNDLADEVSPFSALFKAATNVGFTASATANFIATTVLEAAMVENRIRIRATDLAYESYTIGRECDYLQADLVYTLRDLHREQLLVELDVLDAIWNIQVEFSGIQSLINQRARLEAEWRDNEQLAVDIAAARSDPNVRIFKNDAIINADRSFERALAEAWKATRMFEYYTAQSYPDRDKLFLIRLVDRGDINLRRYLQDLEDDFFDFEQQFGNPDTRLAIISVKDDVLRVPRYSDDGQNRVLTSQERTDHFRAMLADPARLNDQGALEISFSTTFDQLSPLTANHKILFVEIGLYGQDLGDPVGRVYLSQRGTGVVEGTDDDRRFFTFPARTAVMNPFMNAGEDDIRLGQDSDGAIAGPTRSIYRSYRFRERPVVQTDWSLVLDQRGEEVNRDISLAGMDDIVVYLFYTDFTRD